MEILQDVGNIAEQVDELLKDVPIESEVLVPLPSLGKFYKSGKVTVIPITLGVEKNLAKLKDRAKGERDLIRLLLQEVTKDVEVDDILLMDKVTILFHLRRISFGDLIQFDAPCSKCSTINSVSFKITELPMEYIPEKYREVNAIVLPNTGIIVECRLPRIRDEYLLDGPDALSNIYRFISKLVIDPLGKDKKEIQDPLIISEILTRLIAGDTVKIIEYLGGKDFGYQTTVKFKCSYCSQTNVANIPLGEDFL